MDDLDEQEPLAERYYLALAAAFVRGRARGIGEEGITACDAREETDADVFRAGLAQGLKLHKFKRNADLPRVRRVLSMLSGLAPRTLLDVGSGRGAFLWPLHDAFPDLAVTAIDVNERRATDLAAVTRGGVVRLQSARMDAQRLDFPDESFDGVTMLEVLEHMPDPAAAARAALRVASRFVIATVPSKKDDNPEHIHLFDRRTLAGLFEAAGARRVTVEFVLNHMVVLATSPAGGDR